MKKYLSYQLSLLLVFFSLPVSLQAQTDTVFWFAVPDIIPQYGQPIMLMIGTGNTAANVSITQPAAGATMPAINLTVPANTVHRENLTPHIAILQTAPPATALNYGLKIESDVPIIAYYEVQGMNGTNWVNAESYTLKGSSGLGTSFLIPSEDFVGNTPAYGGTSRGSFDIIATEDNTAITINPKADLYGGYTAGAPFNITLNKGQVWSATALNRSAGSQLPGSTVVSDKQVAVTVKQDCLEGSTTAGGSYGICVDMVGDQIVPVVSLGTEYIAMNGRLSTPGDQLFVTALQNSTEIYRDGGTVPLATISAGQTFRMPVAATAGQTATYIRTNNPVTIWQLTGIGCEFGATQLPQIECSGSSSVLYSRTMPWDLYVNLMVPAGGQNNFQINGVPLTTATWTAVPGTGSQWFATQLNLSSQVAQGSLLTVSNSTNLFHMSVLDGAGTNSTSYGYFSNYNRVTAKASASSDKVCVGDSIRLYALTVRNGTYTWRGPGGFSSSQQNPVIPGADPALQTGWYHLTVSSGAAGICGNGEDSIYINIYARPAVNLGNDISVCLDSVTLVSAPRITPATYLWNTGSTADSLVALSAGVYWLEVTDTNGCAGRDSIRVDLGAAIIVDLGPDLGVCDRDIPVVLSAPQPPGTSYLWSNGLSDTQLTVTRSGAYWVRVERAGCTGSDTVVINVVPTPSLYLGPDTTICEQYPLEVGADIPGAVYSWSTGETTPHTSVNATGAYILTVNLDGCIVRDTIAITAMPPPEIDLGGDRDICPEETIVLDATHGTGSRYVWNTGETTPAVSVTEADTYDVAVTTDIGCMGGDTVLLSYYPKPVVRLGRDTTVCEETPLLLSAQSLNTDSLRWSDGSYGSGLAIRYGGAYMVTAINKCGTASDTINVRQIFCDIWLPNAFTPDGDGLNDQYRILGNIGRMEGVTFSIFNRWGERIFTTHDKYQGWDGHYKGVYAQLGTYVYMLEYSMDGHPYLQKGNFHLLR